MSATPDRLRKYRDAINAWVSLAPPSPVSSSGDPAQLTAQASTYPTRPPIGLRTSSLRGLAPQSASSQASSASRQVSPYSSSASATVDSSRLSPYQHAPSTYAYNLPSPLKQLVVPYQSAPQPAKDETRQLTDYDVVPFLHATEYPFPHQEAQDLSATMQNGSQPSLFQDWNAFADPDTPSLVPMASSLDVSPLSPSVHDALHGARPCFKFPQAPSPTAVAPVSSLEQIPLHRRGSDVSPGTGHMPVWPNPSTFVVGQPKNVLSSPANRVTAAQLHSPVKPSPLNPVQAISRKSSWNASRRGSLAETRLDSPSSYWKPFMHSPGSNTSSSDATSPARIPTKLSKSPRRPVIFGPKLGASDSSLAPVEFKVPSLPLPRTSLPLPAESVSLGTELWTHPVPLVSITPNSSSSSTATVTTAVPETAAGKPPVTKTCKTQAALAEQELAGHPLPPIFAANYLLREELGSGGFGFVCTAIHLPTQTPVAVKFIRRHKINDPKKQMVGNEPIEAYVLRKCDHPGIIKLLELYEDAKFFYLVQELHGDPWEKGHTLVNDGTPSPAVTGQNTPRLTMSQSSPSISSLTPPTPVDHWSSDLLAGRPIFGRRASHDLFEACEHNRFTEEQSKKIFRQIVDAVAYLHSKNIFHRDLKDENIVIDHNLTVKIIDFGSAVYKDIPYGTEPNEKFRGTMSYASPEIHKELPYRPGPVDIWAIGIVLGVILTGISPFPNTTNARNGRVQLKRPISDGAFDLLRQCFLVDPSKRATIKDIQQHFWLNPVAASAYETPRRETKARQVSDDALMFDSGKADYRLIARLPKATIP